MAKLGEVCAFQSGGTPSKNKPEYFGGEIPWISTTALNGGKINEADAVAWITPKAIRESAAKIVPANSIMVGTRVGIGKVAINTVEMSTSQDVISLIGIDKDKWYKPYLCKLLLSKKDYFNSQARGATIKGIKIDVVANIDVPEIDYATQRKVAATLNKIETLIVLRKQQLAKLDELVKARFVEMFGEISDNSMNWDCFTIGKLISTIESGWSGNGKQREKHADEIAVLKVSAVTKGYFIPTECKVLDDQHNIKKYVYPQKGDILFSRANTKEMVGATVLIKKDYPDLILPDKLWKIRFCTDVNPIYMKHVLSTTTVRNAFSAASTGTSGSMYNVSMEKFKGVIIPVPPLSVQNEFAAFVERVDQQKQTVQQSLEKLELMKKALMQEYFG